MIQFRLRIDKMSTGRISCYAQEELIDSKIYFKLSIESNSKEDFVNNYMKIFNINNNSMNKVWEFVRTRIWDSNDSDSFLSVKENCFLNEVLINGGCVSRSRLKKCKVLGNDYKVTTTAKSLMRMFNKDSFEENNGMIEQIVFPDNDVYYCLNLKFYKEVFSEDVK